MTITVNQNDDTVTIDNGKKPIVFDKVKNTYQIRQILEEVLNAINFGDEDNRTEFITLEWIDEDTRSTIGEW